MNRFHFNFITWQKLHRENILGFYEVVNINTDTPEELIFLEPEDYKGNLHIDPFKVYKIKTNRGTWYMFGSVSYKTESTDLEEEIVDIEELKKMYL